MAGKRSTLHERIDQMEKAETVTDLLKYLIPTLRELAYRSTVPGGADAAIEDWHDRFTDKLYEEATAAYLANKDEADARADCTKARLEAASRGEADPAASESRASAEPAGVAYSMIQPAPPIRPPPEKVPDSLLALLRENDDGSYSGESSSDDDWDKPVETGRKML